MISREHRRQLIAGLAIGLPILVTLMIALVTAAWVISERYSPIEADVAVVKSNQGRQDREIDELKTDLQELKNKNETSNALLLDKVNELIATWKNELPKAGSRR